MITVHNLTKTYGENTVLNIDHLEIPKGQSFGLVGNNGAGKTTLFSLLLDLIQPSSGHIINKDVQVDQSEDWKPFTSAFIDETFLIGYLTPEEYFYFIGELRGRFLPWRNLGSEKVFERPVQRKPKEGGHCGQLYREPRSDHFG